MSDLWFPEADLSRKASVDGGSILGGKAKCLWHDTETTGLPSYSTDYWPNMTICGSTPYQHIPADRAARALRNPVGGVQTNRWNVFQIEVCGYANKVEYVSVMRDVAQWLKEARGCPLTCTVDTLPYPESYGDTSVRLSGSAWNDYTGHLFHMNAPENDHGDPGSPFPIDLILSSEATDVGGLSVADVDDILAKLADLQADVNELKKHTITKGSDGNPTSDATLAYRRLRTGTSVPSDSQANLQDITNRLARIEERIPSI